MSAYDNSKKEIKREQLEILKTKAYDLSEGLVRAFEGEETKFPTEVVDTIINYSEVMVYTILKELGISYEGE